MAASQFPAITRPDGVVASLVVPFSGARAGSTVELHADSQAPKLAQIIGNSFVVNDSGNDNDGDVTDGICDTGNKIAGYTGRCTLAAAIEQANYNGVTAMITFAPAVVTITPASIYPEITVQVTVDGLSGRTQRVQLDGRNASGGGQIYDPSGLSIYHGGSTVTGITVFGFQTGIKVASSDSGSDTIQNNWIGVDNTGSVPAGRTLTYGILLENYPNAGNNLIGGTASGQGNLIVTPSGTGIAIASNQNTVQGNLIGTDSTGRTLLGAEFPIHITDSSSNLIGGATAGAGNVIAGANTTCGTSFSCAMVDISTGNAAANANMVQGNYIGTDITGTVALGGNSSGIYNDGPNTTIGGTTAAARNLISGAGGFGLTTVYAALVEGNYIGTNAAGTAKLPNGLGGVAVQASSTTIGGSSGAGNLISGNGGPGISINQSYVSNVSVLGNIIGLNAAGTAALGNSGDGLNVTDISGGGHIFGSAGTGNVISGNTGNGISTAAGSVTIQANLIGTNAAGTAAIANGGDGINLNAALTTPTLVGGAQSNQANVISGNLGNGVTVSASNPFTIQGNWIGTDATGANAIPNGKNGVLLTGGGIPGDCGYCADYNGQVKANTIANNPGFGVDLDYGFYITIQGNSIFANTAGGIKLANGSNNGIAAPVLTSAMLNGGNLQVQGSISNAPYGFPATIEVFTSPASDSPVEGRKSLGTATVNSTGAFSISVPAASAQVITATVTDNGGETSAFSNGVAVQAPCAPDVSG
jgi:hypothetical protein